MFDVEDEYAESDIPTTLIRSKADCPGIEVRLFKTMLPMSFFQGFETCRLNIVLLESIVMLSNKCKNDKNPWEEIHLAVPYETSTSYSCDSFISLFIADPSNTNYK